MLTGTFQDAHRNGTNNKTAAITEGYTRFHLPRFFLSSWFKSTRPDQSLPIEIPRSLRHRCCTRPLHSALPNEHLRLHLKVDLFF
jgi:hypothetical protein